VRRRGRRRRCGLGARPASGRRVRRNGPRRPLTRRRSAARPRSATPPPPGCRRARSWRPSPGAGPRDRPS
jgi:hypothetical protein